MWEEWEGRRGQHGRKAGKKPKDPPGRSQEEEHREICPWWPVLPCWRVAVLILFEEGHWMLVPGSGLCYQERGQGRNPGRPGTVSPHGQDLLYISYRDNGKRRDRGRCREEASRSGWSILRRGSEHQTERAARWGDVRSCSGKIKWGWRGPRDR